VGGHGNPFRVPISVHRRVDSEGLLSQGRKVLDRNEKLDAARLAGNPSNRAAVG
jgi:hypothetical protein